KRTRNVANNIKTETKAKCRKTRKSKPKIVEVLDTYQLDETNKIEQYEFKPSDEQNEIMMGFEAGYNCKIEAVAGSGKTTTLLLLAKIATEKFGVASCILTYNRGLKDEIEEKIEKNKLKGKCNVYT